MRVTLTAQLTQCSSCGPFGNSSLNAQVKVYDVRATAVCATPTNFRETAAYDAGNGVLHFEYAWDSSSGTLSDLKCDIGERVDYDPGDLPFPSPPFPAGISPSNPTQNSQDAALGTAYDNHITAGSFVTPYNSRSVVASQVYRFSCPCYSSGDWITIAGPHDITRSVISNGGGSWRFEVTKTGESATINPLP